MHFIFYNEKSRAIAQREASSLNPSQDPRFSTEELRLSFPNKKFKIIGTRCLDLQFYQTFCPEVIEINQHYQLDSIIFCRHAYNPILCSEFYHNLCELDPHHYRTRVATRDMLFDLDMFLRFLRIRPSVNRLFFSASLPDPLPTPFSHLTLDLMYADFFEGPRPKKMSTVPLSPKDNAFYKMIVSCIYPLSSRDQGVLRPVHLFLMYALKHRLDFDLGYWVFRSIIYYSGYNTSFKVHMIQCHVLTAYIANLGVGVHRGELIELSDFDLVGVRQLSLAGIKTSAEGLVYKRTPPYYIPPTVAAPIDEDDPIPVTAPPPVVIDPGFAMTPFFDFPQSSSYAPPPPPTSDFFTRLRDDIFSRFDSLETKMDDQYSSLQGQVADIRHEMIERTDALQKEQQRIFDYLRDNEDEDE
mgnify:CR=1 FL=1